jgi:polyisoprenoid-binding protein YceI
MWNYLFLVAIVGLILTPSLSSAQGELLRFRLLPQESKILTEISDPFGGTVRGEFSLKEGEARGQIENLRDSGWVRLIIDAASYNSNLGLRDLDVQDNYLHVKDYPMIAFTSTGIEEVKESRSGRESWQLLLSGILELHGVQREIRLPVRLTKQGRKLIVDGSAKIFLKDFDIAVPTLLFFLRSGDQAEMKFRFVGEQQP